MLHTLCSQLHTEVSGMPFKVSDSFINENQVVAVLSGGTEAQFVELVKEKKIDLKRPVYMLVSGQQLVSCSIGDFEFHPSAQRNRQNHATR